MSTARFKTLRQIAETRHGFGAKAAGYWLISKVAEKSVGLEISELFSMDTDKLQPSNNSSRFTFRFLNRDEVAGAC